MTVHRTADFNTIRQGLEGRDAALLASLYTEDATLRIVDRDHPPSRPLLLEGRTAIGAYYQDVCSRDMEHHLQSPVTDAQHLAFTESCRYPDGVQVLCATTMDVKDGKITSQLAVQAWDA